MALSVRVGPRPLTEHYLLHSTPGGVCLEGATRYFSAIPLLILCYCENIVNVISDIPVGLRLPRAVMEAKTHQELNALSLLGQDFWSSPVSQQPPVTYPSLMKSSFHTTISPYQSGTPADLKASLVRSAKSHAEPTLVNGTATTASTSKSSPPTIAYRSMSPPHEKTSSTNNGVRSQSAIQTQQSFQDSLSTKSNFELYSRPKKLLNGGGKINRNGSQCTKVNTADMPSPVDGMSVSVMRSASENSRRRYLIRKPTPLTSSQTQLEHSAESPFVTPVRHPGGKGMFSPYYKGNLVDRMSDYEDVWSATPKSDRQMPFFKPIAGSHSIESLIDQYRFSEDGDDELSSINPGYHSDTESELDFVQRTNYVSDLTTKRETEHVEKTETVTRDRILRQSRRPDPVMFTFDLPPPTLMMNSHGLIRSQPKDAGVTAGQGSNGMPLTPPSKPLAHSSVNDSPAYAEPVDSLIGKVNGASRTTSVLKIVNSFKPIETNWPAPLTSSMDKPVAMSTPILNSYRTSDMKRISPQQHPATLAAVPTRSPSHKNSSLATELRIDFRKEQALQNTRKNVAPPTTRNTFKLSMQRLKEQERNEHSTEDKSSNGKLKMSLQKIRELDTHNKKPCLSSHEELTMSPGYRLPIDVLREPPGIDKAPSQCGLPGNVEPMRATSTPHRSQAATMPQKCDIPKSTRKSSVPTVIPSMIPSSTNSPLAMTPHTLAVSQYFENIFKPDYLQTNENEVPPPFPEAARPKFAIEDKRTSVTCSATPAGVACSTAVEHRISDIEPEFTVQQIQPLTVRNVQRISEYDGGRSSSRVPSSAGTFYCSPWDSNVWQELIDLGVTPNRSTRGLKSPFSASSAPDIYDSRDEASSAGDYSSMYADSEGTHAHSETMASELATSFEWQSESDLHELLGPSLGKSGPSSAVSAPAVHTSVAPVVRSIAEHKPLMEHKPLVEHKPVMERVFSEPEQVTVMADPLSSGSRGNRSLEKSALAVEKAEHKPSSTERRMRDRGTTEHRSALQPIPLAMHASPKYTPRDTCSKLSPVRVNNASKDKQRRLPCVNSDINLEQKLRDITQEAVSEDEELEVEYAARCRPRPILACPRVVSLRTRQMNHAGVAVRDYVSNMAQHQNTTFGKTVENFIQCTKEASETNPNIVVRNVRQFMSGIKNYLVQTGEENLSRIIDRERTKLSTTEFLNIDAVLEGALHRCVVKPLKQHIYKLYVKAYQSNGNLQALTDNIKYARTKTPQQLGIKNGLVVPKGASLEVIRHFLNKMQVAYSPLKKLENLLGAVSSIYNNVDNGTGSSPDSAGNSALGTDDLLPMLIYLLSHCEVVSAEIELDYMLGLVHPGLLAGEGGYYLTALSSAIQVLKGLRQTMEASPAHSLPSPSDLDGFLKVLIPDEQDDSITTKTVPVRRSMTTKDVCNIIAHQLQVTNPQDYGLYILILGIEDQLTENAWPLSVKAEMQTGGRECVFAYKRNNAKYVWPVKFGR